jgi:5-formyltetrahydrofolate cyclo-ligase
MSDPTSTDHAKKALRKAVLARMAALGSERAREAGEALARARLEFLGSLSGRAIGAFHSFGNELPTGPLLSRLCAEGAVVGLPVVIRKGEPLVFRRWQPGDAMGEGPFGIRQPLASAPEVRPDILFVPLVAFDDQGFRLGYGGGFYDRTIAKLRGEQSVVTIGLAYDEQEVTRVPREAHDQRLDFMLTPSKLHKFME